MKEFSNILVTSLSRQGDRKSHRYFYFERNGEAKYCDGLSVAEAGTKYILAEVDIDDIIVLGAGRTYDEGQELKHVVLREWSDYAVNDTKDLSEYSFLQYRIAQFIDGLDMEAIDVLEDMDPDRAQELYGYYEKFCQSISDEEGYKPERVFHMIAQNENLYNRLIDSMPELSDKELLWLERYIYTKCSDDMKLSCRNDNTDISICFIPTSKDQTNNYVPAQNVAQIVNVINAIDAEKINIYMDMQGLASTEGYTILAVLSMLSNEVHSRIEIKEIITSHYRAGQFAGYIDNNEMKRYEINKLISGMSAFVHYGKVDEIMSYWKSRGIENKHVDSLLNAMRRVDEGISLCNTSDLETGINYLRYLFKNTPKEELPEVESNIFRILEDSIRRDYGALLEGDSLDALELVRWAMNKGFYQQCLTIIESRIPRNIVDSGFLYYAVDEASKTKALEEFNKLYWDAAPKDRWGFDDLAHYFIKFYGRAQIRNTDTAPNTGDRQRDFTQYRIAALDNKSEGIIKSYSALADNRELLEKVLYSYYALGSIRNNVNHAADQPAVDFMSVDMENNENVNLLRDGIFDFVKAYDEARAYIAEHAKEPIVNMQITKEEFKTFTNDNKMNNAGKKSFQKNNNFRKNNNNRFFRGNRNRFDNNQNRQESASDRPKPVQGQAASAEHPSSAMRRPAIPAVRTSGNEQHVTVKTDDPSSKTTRIVIDIE
ncbi:MAG: hypothetical protein IKG37_10535 [Solobacterium sp.]|nr:hypothetical protein [Solobacterium sp.]